MKLVRSIIKGALWRAGYEVRARNMEFYGENSMPSALERLRSLGIQPANIIDVGAAQGTWTLKSLQYWPQASYDLLEPLIEQEVTLAALKKAHPNINYHMAVAGEKPGTIQLNVSDDLDGSGIYGDRSDNARNVQVKTIDEIGAGKTGPFLIKLDTHGYEEPILKGAVKTLENTVALVIEVYGFKISPTCLLFHELSDYLYQTGFRLIDMVDIMRRPKDHAFWQADAVFIRKDHSSFSKNSYSW